MHHIKPQRSLQDYKLLKTMTNGHYLTLFHCLVYMHGVKRLKEAIDVLQRYIFTFEYVKC